MERTAAERLRDLQVDLGDGDDLAVALSLIGDALQRRIRRVRRSLRDIEQDTSDEQLSRLVERVRTTLGRYEQDVTASHEQLSEVIDAFQVELSASAAVLEVEFEERE